MVVMDHGVSVFSMSVGTPEYDSFSLVFFEVYLTGIKKIFYLFTVMLVEIFLIRLWLYVMTFRVDRSSLKIRLTIVNCNQNLWTSDP